MGNKTNKLEKLNKEEMSCIYGGECEKDTSGYVRNSTSTQEDTGCTDTRTVKYNDCDEYIGNCVVWDCPDLDDLTPKTTGGK